MVIIMADNEKALKKLFELCKELEENKIDFIEFLHQGDIVLFNDMSSDGVRYFSDGWREGCASNIYQYVLKAYNGDEKALNRLLIDLEIEECNLEIRKVD